jgi:hypothetical protein
MKDLRPIGRLGNRVSVGVVLVVILTAVIIVSGSFFYPKVTANRLDISEGTQGQFEDLRLGLGYTRVGDYVDDKGVARHGNTAGLWLYVRDNAAQNRTLDVYEGQSFTVNKYRVLVDQIVLGSEKGSVSLFIWESKK